MISSLVEKAKAEGWIRLDARSNKKGNIALLGYMDVDYGDSDGFGMDVTNLYAELDKDGNYAVAFRDYIYKI